MARLIVVFALVLGLMGAAFASAASLKVDGGAVQVGSDVTICDADGVQVTGWGLETDDDTIRSVTIGGIDAACNGNDMFVKVLDSADGLEAYVSEIPITATSQKVSFVAPFPSAVEVAKIKVWIEGSFSPNN